jgi:Threonine dehydrogenase and related Zn-dependent dehydrogenases
MRALAKIHSKPGIWVVERDKPHCGDHEVIIKVKKTAICGTDIHIYQWDQWAQNNIPIGTITGHEFVGIIHEKGSHVSDHFRIGQRVSAEGHLTCGKCRNCLAGIRHLCPNTTGIGVQHNGAFAEYISVPESNLYPIPDDISDDIAAIFDPLGNAVHTALTYDSVGEDILITGSGPIGIMAAMICQHIGARHVVITDVNEYRLQLAQKCGIRHAININNEKLKDVQKSLGMTEGFDVSLEMSGTRSGLNDIFEQTRLGGSIALLGIFKR